MSSTLEFNGFDLTAQQSPGGGRFTLTSLDGWLSISQRRDRAAKVQQAGSYGSQGHAENLPVTARGTAVYATAAAAAVERRNLIALGGGGTYEMTVVDAAGPGTRFVECDALDVSPVMDRMFRWSLAVTATDPLLYGSESFAQTGLSSVAGGAGLTYPLTYPLSYGAAAGVTPGVTVMANAGTASYHPRLRIDGPVTNVVLTLAETGDRVALSGSVAAGQWVDVDCANRRVLLNGQVSLRHRVSSVGSWLAVPVGGGSLSWTADGGSSDSSLSVWSYLGAWL